MTTRALLIENQRVGTCLLHIWAPQQPIATPVSLQPALEQTELACTERHAPRQHPRQTQFRTSAHRNSNVAIFTPLQQ